MIKIPHYPKTHHRLEYLQRTIHSLNDYKDAITVSIESEGLVDDAIKVVEGVGVRWSFHNRSTIGQHLDFLVMGPKPIMYIQDDFECVRMKSFPNLVGDCLRFQTLIRNWATQTNHLTFRAENLWRVEPSSPCYVNHQPQVRSPKLVQTMGLHRDDLKNDLQESEYNGRCRRANKIKVFMRPDIIFRHIGRESTVCRDQIHS